MNALEEIRHKVEVRQNTIELKKYLVYELRATRKAFLILKAIEKIVNRTREDKKTRSSIPYMQ